MIKRIRLPRAAISLVCAQALIAACAAPARVVPDGAPVGGVTPLAIGETWLIYSAALEETRRINVYVPAGYAGDPALRLPVLYMPDGGIGEDFLHIAGLLQISILNGTVRPSVLVGIENTQRRRDLTGPTDSDEDRGIAVEVGGSAAFRTFLRSELIPFINERYRTTGERSIVGESLAGLFVVETLLEEPDLFDTYIAIDPSLWWNNEELVNSAASRFAAGRHRNKVLYLASSGQVELAELARRLSVAGSQSGSGVVTHYKPMPAETHSTIYHPAALVAFREVFKP